ncbi:hypothetical protein B0I35DRAFT_437781 [Stachybotrys elegans]|uniref:Rhodopsin domain-containing protein n=1 Tax=Stachybotrys elegans TaxID=80388 RepID=A0A8K0SQB5_9HYPO|nr:hypothetical protein B0I35DRAFT_437781 [Stachybotrys elegans]
MSLPPNVPLDRIPSGQPPPGVIPNFVNPPSYAHEIRVLEGVFMSLMLIAVLVRVYVRFRLVKAWGWDDYFCIAAAFGSLAHMIMYTQTLGIGFGRHIWDIPVSMLVGNSYLFSVNGIIYPLTILFAKLSILLLFVRIFSVNQGMRITIYVGMAVLTLFYVAMACVAIASMVQCDGLDADSIQFCRNYSGPIILLNASFNVATDFWILLMPIPLLLKLNLRLRQKLGIVAVFLAGVAACAASLARLIEFSINYHSEDVLWTQAINACFTIVEINIAIIVASSSCLPAFYKHAHVSLLSTSSSIRRFFTTRGTSVHSQTSIHNQSSESMKMRRSTEIPDVPPLPKTSYSERS